jgi:divalent metal cation (Fe/Co/Zn/Cd) transporter
MGDIFQILFTSIAIVLMVGTVPILKLLAIMIFSYIIRESFSSTKEKVKTIVKKCYYCEDFWK